MKVLIATPVYDDQVLVPYFLSTVDLLRRFAGRAPSFEISVLNATLVSRARNAFVSRVLADASITHLLFIDADMGFRPSLVEKMLAFDRPLLGVVAPRRKIDRQRLLKLARASENAEECWQAAQEYVGDPTDLVVAADGRLEVSGSFARARRAGAGIMMIRRDVLEEMGRRYPELWAEEAHGFYRSAGLQRVFQPFEAYQEEGGMFLSEDYSFCRRWTEIGGEIWSCLDETITHVGRERFVGNYLTRLRVQRRG